MRGRRFLHFDCFAGASGNMLLGSLLSLGVPAKIVREGLASLEIEGLRMRVSKVRRGALAAHYVAFSGPKRQPRERRFTQIREPRCGVRPFGWITYAVEYQFPCVVGSKLFSRRFFLAPGVPRSPSSGSSSKGRWEHRSRISCCRFSSYRAGPGLTIRSLATKPNTTTSISGTMRRIPSNLT